MRAASPTLRRRITPTTNNLAVLDTASWFRPLSSDVSRMDGLNVFVALVDEVHEHPSAEVIEKLDTGVGARLQPLMYETTTAGVNRNSVCYQHSDFRTKVLEGTVQEITADRWFAYMAFDRTLAGEIVRNLMDEGMNMVEFGHASAEQFFMAHVVHSLAHWVERFEQAAERDLIGDEAEQGDFEVVAKMSLQFMVRGDAKARADFYASAIVNGWMTRADTRDLEDLPMLPGLDVPLQPLNMGQGGKDGQAPIQQGPNAKEAAPCAKPVQQEPQGGLAA
jgi:hypothetical protein